MNTIPANQRFMANSPSQQHACTIMVVDDEPYNLEIINTYLGTSGHRLECVENGEKALTLLQANPDHYDIILLDRMLPDIEGLDILKRIKAHDKLKHTPVILQTAKARKEEVSEGIRAGAFYYLTKPFDEETLVSIVDAAAMDIVRLHEREDELRHVVMMDDLLQRCELTVRSLEEGRRAAVYISHLFPRSEDALYGVSELIINAIEHGNAGITYHEKTDLLVEGCWEQEVNKRLEAEENKEKYVQISYYKKPHEVHLLIEDQGQGFNSEPFMEIDPMRACDNHGRGIALSRLISFDELTYEAGGTIAHAVCKL